jgi:hypothetical protein
MRPVNITKLSSTDAFVVVDLPDAPVATGVVRCARKVLQDGAVNMARTLTYTYAAFGLQRSGASAAVNAEGDARDAAVAAFVEELAPRVAAGELVLRPGKGVTTDDLAAWGEPAPDTPGTTAALPAGIVAAAGAVTDLAGTTVAVETGTPEADAIAAAFGGAGADAAVLPLPELLAAGRAVIVVGSKPGVLDHHNVGALGAATIVGAAGLSITARGLATATRHGATVLPDFVTSAGPVVAAAGEQDVAGRTAAVVAAALAHPEGPYLGACYAAEEFLRTWAAELPFGRPLA